MFGFCETKNVNKQDERHEDEEEEECDFISYGKQASSEDENNDDGIRQRNPDFAWSAMRVL